MISRNNFRSALIWHWLNADSVGSEGISSSLIYFFSARRIVFSNPNVLLYLNYYFLIKNKQLPLEETLRLIQWSSLLFLHSLWWWIRNRLKQICIWFFSSITLFEYFDDNVLPTKIFLSIGHCRFSFSKTKKIFTNYWEMREWNSWKSVITFICDADKGEITKN